MNVACRADTRYNADPMAAAPTIRTIHFADFSGDLRTTECGLELDDGLANGTVSVFMSAATCPSCRHAIDHRIAAQFSGVLPSSAPSSASRI